MCPRRSSGPTLRGGSPGLIFNVIHFLMSSRTPLFVQPNHILEATVLGGSRERCSIPRTPLLPQPDHILEATVLGGSRERCSIPRAARGVVLMVNEYNTSKMCPGCLTKTSEDKERRIRSCKNFKIGNPGESCRLHPEKPEFEMDRAWPAGSMRCGSGELVRIVGDACSTGNISQKLPLVLSVGYERDIKPARDCRIQEAGLSHSRILV